MNPQPPYLATCCIFLPPKSNKRREKAITAGRGRRLSENLCFFLFFFSTFLRQPCKRTRSTALPRVLVFLVTVSSLLLGFLCLLLLLVSSSLPSPILNGPQWPLLSVLFTPVLFHQDLRDCRDTAAQWLMAMPWLPLLSLFFKIISGVKNQ